MAAGIVNIRRDVDDKFYRYRMPLLLTKIEGKGNGIKTVVPNMSDIARALSRPPSYITKFFGCELGAQTPFDEKNDRYIVNGAHDASRLRELLDGFINKFVLCRSCKNPETDLVITKVGRREDIFRDCKACGERTAIDMRHKLVTFILKNPPQTKKSKKNMGEANGNGNGVHATATTPHAEHQADANADEDDDELLKKIQSQAAALSIEPLRTNGRGDDGSEDGASDGYSEFGQWVRDNKGLGPEMIFAQAQRLKVDGKSKAVAVLVPALFTEDMEKEIPVYLELLKQVRQQCLNELDNNAHVILDDLIREATESIVGRPRTSRSGDPRRHCCSPKDTHGSLPK